MDSDIKLLIQKDDLPVTLQNSSRNFRQQGHKMSTSDWQDFNISKSWKMENVIVLLRLLCQLTNFSFSPSLV